MPYFNSSAQWVVKYSETYDDLGALKPRPDFRQPSQVLGLLILLGITELLL